jgi:multiple sugar transport system substrate-binding protein
VVGFNPFPSWYENVPAHFAPSWGATWMNGDKSALDTPEWQALLKWQKSLIDYYGWSNLVRFNAGAGDEFSASNAFETGKVAMHMDGEWRVAFIKREHPELKYGTAPFPVADDKQDLYGAGYTTGSIIGIPRTSKHKDQAWLLVKYLGTNSNALAKLSNGIQNVPTTTDSLHSPLLKPLPGFQTFLDVFGNKHTLTTPITRIGSANQETFQSFVTKYLSGSSKNLSGGLKKVDLQIDALLQQQQAGSAP